MQNGRWSVERIDTKDGLSELRGEWTRLLPQSRSDCLFLTWEWLSTWYRRLGAGRRLAVLAVRDGHELVGIAPLVERQGLVSRLELMGTGAVGSDYLDLIVDREREEPVLDAIARRLAGDGRPVTFGQLRAGDSLAGDLAERLGAGGWAHDARGINECPYIELRGHTWDSYLGELSSSHRYNFRRRRRNLDADFEVELERPSEPDAAAEALEVLIELHRRRWDERGGSDALHREALVDFHREFARQALEKGWLRLFVLRLDGRPAAALYGLRYADSFLFYQSGFDTDYGNYSVGLVLLGLTIRSALAEGAAEYDLLHGAERYKFHWASRSRQLECLECVPPGARGALLRHGRGLGRRGKRLLRDALPEPVTAALAGLRGAAS